MVTDFPTSATCTGDAGSVVTPDWAKATLRYYLDDGDVDAIAEAAFDANDRVECLQDIAEGVASGKSFFYIALWKCNGAKTNVIKDILNSYGKYVEFR